MLEILTTKVSNWEAGQGAMCRATYASTLENSCEGCITKLSDDDVHEIRCEMLLSSNMLSPG